MKDLKEIVLSEKDEISEKYKVIHVDESSIRMYRRAEFSRVRILPLECIFEGEWYYDFSRHEVPDIRSNIDGQLLKQMNNMYRDRITGNLRRTELEQSESEE